MVPACHGIIAKTILSSSSVDSFCKYGSQLRIKRDVLCFLVFGTLSYAPICLHSAPLLILSTAGFLILISGRQRAIYEKNLLSMLPMPGYWLRDRSKNDQIQMMDKIEMKSNQFLSHKDGCITRGCNRINWAMHRLVSDCICFILGMTQNGPFPPRRTPFGPQGQRHVGNNPGPGIGRFPFGFQQRQQLRPGMKTGGGVYG